MALQLNTTTSIVDYLKSIGKDPSSRSTLYKDSGLADRLGPYVGSGAQNMALLKQLQTNTTKESITPTTTAIRPSSYGIDAKTGLPVGPENDPLTRMAPTEASPTGITATEALSTIPKLPSNDEILSNVLGSPEFQNYQLGQEAKTAFDVGKAAAEKAKLASTAAAETRSFIDKMGRRGLFFSGETQQGIQALASGLAASTLGVDRQLANDLLQSDVKTREQIMSRVEKVVNDARKGREDAISALEKVGLTIIGNQVVPTLAARNYDLAITREGRLQQQAEIKNELDAAKFELSQAKTTAQLEIATARLELAEERARNAASSLSAAEKKAAAAVSLYSPYILKTIEADLTPQDALEAANKAAIATGVVLGVEEQNAIVQAATVAQLERQKTKPTRDQATTAVSKVEAAIERSRRPGLLDSDIRDALRRQGFTQEEINASSVASFQDRAAAAGQGVTGFFTRLFSR